MARHTFACRAFTNLDPRVLGVYDVTGDRNRDELNGFIKDFLGTEHVERTATQLVLNTVKEERRVVV